MSYKDFIEGKVLMADSPITPPVKSIVQRQLKSELRMEHVQIRLFLASIEMMQTERSESWFLAGQELIDKGFALIAQSVERMNR